MSSKWVSSGPNVYDEHGEWVADCRVPSIHSQAQVEAIAQQIADDHNRVGALAKLLGEAREYVEKYKLAMSGLPATRAQRVLADIDAALGDAQKS